MSLLTKREARRCICGQLIPLWYTGRYCQNKDCGLAQLTARGKVGLVRGPYKPKDAPKPVVVTHIAGYVPPKGSVVQMLFGRVIAPIRGLGL